MLTRRQLGMAALGVAVLLAVSSQAPAALISGTVFNDLNGDGSSDAGTDPGLQGWTVNLLDGSNNIVGTANTDLTGLYTISGVGPGTYTVSEVLQGGWVQTAPTPIPPGSYSVTVSDTDITGQDFGDFQTVTVSGNVYNDKSNNGQQNTGEPGLKGWTVNVVDSSNVVVSSATTDASGNYTVQNVGPGSFTLQEEVQPGWTITQPTNPTYYSFTSNSGVNVVGGLFGNFNPDAVTTVPEPASLTLLGLGALGLLGYGWRKRRLAKAA